MKKITLIILTIFLTTILLNPTDITKSVTFSFDICIHNLFPALFPFLIISNLMSHYGLIELCSAKGKKIMNKFFKVNENGAYVLIMSMLSGSPSNAKYINQLLDRNLINEKDANTLLTFTHFVNPLFIIGSIGTSFLQDYRLGIIILISNYLGNIIIGLTNKNDYTPLTNKDYKYQKQSFMHILTHAINDTINTLMLILGVITTCLIFTMVVNKITHIPSIFNGILEITQGVKLVSLSHLTNLYKVILITFFISFGGFSIHMQVMSILENKKIKYLPYLKARLTHGIISSIIVTILYLMINF